MQKYKYVIIGGGVAGGSAIKAIRQIDAEGSLALITQEPHHPYERPPLSKGFLTGDADLGRVYLQSSDFYAEQGIDLLTNTRAIDVVPDRHLVTLEKGNSLNYERLLLATGGHAWRLPIPGNNLPGVFTLRTIEDAINIRSSVGKGKRALVLGGSFIGSEVAASLAKLGVQTSMVFPESRLLERIVTQEMSEFLHNKYAEHNVRILPGVTPERLEGQDFVERAILDNGETLEIDLVVMGVGIKLNTELARKAKLGLNEEGAVLVDEYLRTSDLDIYAAGDIVSWPDLNLSQRLRLEHWDVARRQGLRAGRNMAGDKARYTALPYFFSDLFDLSFEVWGNLASWNRTVLRGSLEEGSFAYYYFNQGRMTGVLAAGRPDSERLPMQTLVKEQPTYEEVEISLQDEKLNLAELPDKAQNAEGEHQMAKLSFTQDIRPMFRKKDVDEMKDISELDLSDYDSVKEQAQGIYSRLADGSMPCDGPWTEEKLDQFKQWMDQGMNA